jgi:hypothetical protein
VCVAITHVPLQQFSLAEHPVPMTRQWQLPPESISCEQQFAALPFAVCPFATQSHLPLVEVPTQQFAGLPPSPKPLMPGMQHAFVLRSHAMRSVPPELHVFAALHCAFVVHPHVPFGSQCGPGVHDAQLWQSPPDAPHAVSDTPAMHVPFAPEQHPPLQDERFGAPHWLVQSCVVRLHAVPPMLVAGIAAGQSLAASHPQKYGADQVSHFAPVAPPHTAHLPEEPHAAAVFPLTHDPPEQHVPPLQVPLPAAPHVLVHMPPVHVGVPPMHVVHMAPAAPQDAFDVPG